MALSLQWRLGQASNAQALKVMPVLNVWGSSCLIWPCRMTASRPCLRTPSLPLTSAARSGSCCTPTRVRAQDAGLEDASLARRACCLTWCRWRAGPCTAQAAAHSGTGSEPFPTVPTLSPTADPAKERKLLAEHFESLEAEEEDADAAGGGSGGEEDYSEEEEAAAARRRSTAHRDKRLRSSEEAGPSGREPRMYAAKDEAAAAAFMQRKSFAAEKAQPLGQRAATVGEAANAVARSGGSKELTFTPRYAPDGKGRGGRGGRGGGRGGGGRSGGGRSGGGRSGGSGRGRGRGRR